MRFFGLGYFFVVVLVKPIIEVMAASMTLSTSNYGTDNITEDSQYGNLCCPNTIV